MPMIGIKIFIQWEISRYLPAKCGNCTTVDMQKTTKYMMRTNLP